MFIWLAIVIYFRFRNFVMNIISFFFSSSSVQVVFQLFHSIWHFDLLITNKQTKYTVLFFHTSFFSSFILFDLHEEFVYLTKLYAEKKQLQKIFKFNKVFVLHAASIYSQMQFICLKKFSMS